MANGVAIRSDFFYTEEQCEDVTEFPCVTVPHFAGVGAVDYVESALPSSCDGVEDWFFDARNARICAAALTQLNTKGKQYKVQTSAFLGIFTTYDVVRLNRGGGKL